MDLLVIDSGFVVTFREEGTKRMTDFPKVRDIGLDELAQLFPGHPFIPALGGAEVTRPAVCIARGWGWRVAGLREQYALLWKDGAEILDEPRTLFCLADRARLLEMQ